MFRYPFRLPFSHPFRGAFSLPGFGEPIPPASDNLLVQLKGNDDGDTKKLDSWKKPDAENFVMKGALCASLNGVDGFGDAGVIPSTSIVMGVQFVYNAKGSKQPLVSRRSGNDVIYVDGGSDKLGVFIMTTDGIETFLHPTPLVDGGYYDVLSTWDGLSWVIVLNGVTIHDEALVGSPLYNGYNWIIGTDDGASNFYDGRLWSITLNDAHFRIAEGSGLTSFSDDYENDGHSIAWTASVATLWAQRQDIYFGNALDGYGKRKNLLKWSEDLDTEWSDGLEVTTKGEVYTRFDWVGHPGAKVINNLTGYPYSSTQLYTHLSGEPRYSIPTEEMSFFHVVEDSLGTQFYLSGLFKSDTAVNKDWMYLYANEHSSGIAQVGFQAVNTNLAPYDTKDLIFGKMSSLPLLSLGTVVCTGDSISSAYPNRMAPMLPASTIVNTGVGGDVIQNLIDRFQVDVANHNPDIIMLMIGANDIAQLKTIESIKEDMLKLLVLCDATGATTYINENIPRTGWNPGSTEFTNQTEFNRWMKTLGYDVVLNYETYRQPGTEDLMYSLTDDGVHPDDNYGGEIHLAINNAIALGFVMPVYIKTGDFTITGDEYLPFLNDEKGGTFNNCEVSYGPEESPTALFNGVDDKITLSSAKTLSGNFYVSGYVDITNVGSQIILGGLDAYIRYYAGAYWRVKLNTVGGYSSFISITNTEGKFSVVRIGSDVTLTVGGQSQTITMDAGDAIFTQIGNYGGDWVAGIIRNVDLDGLFIPINEGTGTDIHDSEGNLVGTQAGDESFWDGEPMVSQAIGDAEAASTSGNYLTDGKYHALYMTQQAWGELGSELVENHEFIYWTDPTVPDDWGKIGTHDTNNYVEENVNGCRLVSDGTYIGISQSGYITSGVLNEYSVYVYDISLGGVELAYGASSIELELGLNVFQFTPTTSTVSVKRTFSLGACDATFGNISVREVNQVMNKNKHYYLTKCEGKNVELWIYKSPRSETEDFEILVASCNAEGVGVAGEQVGVNGVPVGVRI